ncbi:hypothetical protein CBS147353_11361 [Aspergillus niger]|nr:hypothetical protein CBS147353_11361 [Aspergillus niger]
MAQALVQSDVVFPDSAGIGAATQKDIDTIWSWNKLCPEQIERCVHEIFEERAQEQPHSMAICAWDGQLLYGELNQLATRLAHQLIKLGIGSDMLIPLCFEKSMWTTVAILAVLKSGAGFVLLDASLPEQRLQTIVRQLKAKLILSSVSNQFLSARLAPQVVSISRQSLTKLDINTDGLLAPVDPCSVMCLSFSSGSTGTPKGAMITHSNFASALCHQAQHLGFTRDSRTYDFSSYAFDVSMSNTFTTLTAGGCLCVPSEQDRTNRLAQSITSLCANVVLLTPSVARLLDPRDTPTLQSVFFGGEKLHVNDVTRWWGRVRIVHAYGPSECTAYSLINSNATCPQEAVRIGKGAGVVTWVVDPEDHDRLLPLGYVGELLLEGPLVGEGYWEDEERTGNSFIRDPVWIRREAPYQMGRQGPRGRRFYKTGDLVKYNEDGSLIYVGRKDTQVKIHGQRVELEEIEQLVQKSIPEAKRVVADLIKSEGEILSPVMAAFIQKYDTSTTSIQQETDIEIFNMPTSIRECLTTYLPRYMMPAVFFSIAKFPTNATGKLDRRRLRELGTSWFQRSRKLKPWEAMPKQLSSVGKQLRDITGRVLGISPALIGLEDDFFRLGGDSIAAMQVVAEAYKAGIEITVSDIFQNPSLAGLANQDYPSVNETIEEIPSFSLLGDNYDATLLIEDIASRYQLHPANIEDAYPCTPLQEGLLSLSLKHANEYVIRRVLCISPSVTTVDFCQAWEKVARNTAILRTRIVQSGDKGLLQLVLNEDIQWVYRTGLDGYLKEDRQRPMELGQPLARYAIVQDNASTRRWFVWTLHHALYDGWSLPLMIDMANRAYGGTPINPAKHEFKVFIKYITELNSKNMVEYWSNTLANCDCSPFPALPQPALRPVADHKITHQIPWLDRRSRDVTTSTLVRAAWAIVASCMVNSDNVVFGITTSGRTAPVGGINEMVGPTIATVPLLVKIIRSQKVSDYLAAVQHQSTSMIPFEHFGLRRIAKICRGAHQACMFQTLLIVQPQGGTEAENTLGEWKESLESEWVNTYALVLEVQIGLKRVDARFDAKVIKPWVVQALLEELEFVLKQLSTAGSEDCIAGIDLVTPRRLEQIWDWNRTVPSPVKASIHQMIEARTQNQPTANAVAAWDGELTYAELDRFAREVAAQLAEFAVDPHLLGPETLVPICSEKSKWTMVAILGVLKLGAGFVLLDPSLPESRLKSIIQKVGSKLLLASHHNMDLSLKLSGIVVQIGPSLLHSSSFLSNHQARPTTLFQPSPSRTMYAVFTSGSTGEPKGVLVSHENFSSAAHYQLELLGFTKESRVLDFASYAFDVAVHNAIATLLAGGCLCIPSENNRKDNIGNVMATMRPTIASLTPTVARLLNPEMVYDLRTLILLGEPVTKRDAERWLSHGINLVNAYGPAECTPISTINVEFQPSTEEAISIGRGAGLVTWIVNPDDPNRLLPPGCTGELLLEGPLVGKGYIKDPEKTAKAFIEDPEWLLNGSQDHPGRHGRLYSTGDLVQYNGDGSLTFMGRKDSQVKIRGQRLELEEVEYHILDCLPGKQNQAVAEVVPEDELNARPVLVAFIQEAGSGMEAKERTPFTAKKYSMAADVKKRLAHRLPSYMVPTALFSVLDLPLTATGKTNRRRLREIGRELLLLEGGQVLDVPEQFLGLIVESEQPAFSLARKVYSMRTSWTQESPSCSKDGPHDQHFGLRDMFLYSSGLDSVNMMELSAWISQNFCVQVSMQYLMDDATSITSLAEYISGTQEDGAGSYSLGHPSTREPTAVDLVAEISRHSSRILTARGICTSYHEMTGNDLGIDRHNRSFSVFLTGANGFIGTQILRQLLGHSHVSRVICLVRGDTDDTARRRTIDRAVEALWWTEHHAGKLEVWRGDLSLPCLGLNPTRWGSLTDGQAANVIIHSGATVHWTKSYRALEAVNVGSTIELLLLATGHPCMRFLYVTGGRPWEPNEEIEVIKELSAADAIGYSQTKFVAEVVVRRAAQRNSFESNRLGVLNPGRVIGTPDEGVSNAGDYIWRLAAACIRIGAYNAAGADGWLSISDGTTTAAAIVDAALGTRMDMVTGKYPMDGMPWRDFWATLGGLGYKLKAQGMADWLALVRADIEAAREKHPLWPLAHMIEALQNERIVGRARKDHGNTSLRLKVAVSRVQVNQRSGQVLNV